VGDGRVARCGLGVVDGTFVGAAGHGPLNTPVLVAEGDLEVEDAFAVALETEVPGLDDARVHRTDSDLVDLLTLNPKETIHGGIAGLKAIVADRL